MSPLASRRPEDPESRPPGSAGEVTIEDLVEQYYPYIRRLAYLILADPDEAQDAAQETFLRAARRLQSFRGEAQPRTWLYAITINVCRGELRKRRARQALEGALRHAQALLDRRQPVEDIALQSEANSRLWGAVCQLDDRQRLALVLPYVDQLTVAEIAAVMQVSEGTVHSRLHYARQKLAHQLGQPLAEPAAPRRTTEDPTR